MKKILRFTASWCGPCKSLATNLETAAIATPIEVIDIDENRELAMKYGIRGVPTLIMLDDDTEVKRIVGVKPVQALKEWAE